MQLTTEEILLAEAACNDMCSKMVQSALLQPSGTEERKAHKDLAIQYHDLANKLAGMHQE
jgi:hypothetical protein